MAFPLLPSEPDYEDSLGACGPEGEEFTPAFTPGAGRSRERQQGLLLVAQKAKVKWSSRADEGQVEPAVKCRLRDLDLNLQLPFLYLWAGFLLKLSEDLLDTYPQFSLSQLVHQIQENVESHDCPDGHLRS